MPVQAEDEEDEEFEAAADDEDPGKVEGTGTHFEVTNSKYLNVILDSSETITLELESVPEMIIMHIGPVSASSTTITISGLAPDTTYHTYEDSYENHVDYTTDSSGSYTYTQDLSVSHLVFIQPRESTKFLTDDATGGDCTSIGTWDDTNNICTLNTDVTETIEIQDDNITLDCDGHTLDGTGTGSGVFLNGRMNVTVRNCTITDFSDGINLDFSDSNEIEDNMVTNSDNDGINLDDSNNNTIYHNTVTDSDDDGIRLDDSNDNDVTNNNINNSGDDGIFCDDDCNNNTIEGNTIRNSDSDGIFFEDDVNDNEILNNIIINSGGDGIEFDDDEDDGNDDNQIKGNCIINANSDGIELDDRNETNDIKNNTIINANDGIDITDDENFDNDIEGNTVIGTSSGGIEIAGGSQDNEVFNNNFINTGDPLDDDGDNEFDRPLPIGGNFWSQFNEPSEGCFNTSPADRFCDD
ncbi:MAG: right-handed parallel beta-helix repeat-containing protein, partial [Nitrososphaerales archaeon]